MTDTLLNAVRRYAEAYADPAGIARTPISGLTTIRATAPSDLDYAISRPLVCLVVQGTKHVTMGNRAFTFSAGNSLLITADVPTVSQITRASIAAPYFSLVLDLDPAVIAELAVEMKAAPAANGAPVRGRADRCRGRRRRAAADAPARAPGLGAGAAGAAAA